MICSRVVDHAAGVLLAVLDVQVLVVGGCLHRCFR